MYHKISNREMIKSNKVGRVKSQSSFLCRLKKDCKLSTYPVDINFNDSLPFTFKFCKDLRHVFSFFLLCRLFYELVIFIYFFFRVFQDFQFVDKEQFTRVAFSFLSPLLGTHRSNKLTHTLSQDMLTK